MKPAQCPNLSWENPKYLTSKRKDYMLAVGRSTEPTNIPSAKTFLCGFAPLRESFLPNTHELSWLGTRELLRERSLFIATAVFILLLNVVLALAFVPNAQAASIPEAAISLVGPDLLIESIDFSPLPPFTPGAEINMTPIVKNMGDEDASKVVIYLYVDPADNPPTTETPNTASFTYGLPLAPGETFDDWTRKLPIPTDNANPQICAWVDPLNEIAEEDEANNRFCIKSVEPPQTPDAYDTEDNNNDDDTCANATVTTTDGSLQSHNLARTDDKADVDWIQFEAISGVEYSITATPFGEDGADAALVITVHPACDAPGTGDGPNITFGATEDKTYYAKVTHQQSEYGPSTAYQLSVTAQSDCRGLYEPNDACTMPVDFPLSTGSQTHSFCKAGDVDWLRFEVEAGGQYRVSTENIGANADPRLSIYPSCDASSLPDQSFDFTAPTDGYYYLRAENGDPNAAGADTEYKVNVEVLAAGCAEDTFEQDDDSASAPELTIDGEEQDHNVCPQGEEDWVKISATKGTTFTVETLNLDVDADTYLCLFDRSGNKLNCDRDGGAGLGSRVLMRNVSDDLYYARITDENGDVAGDTTSYSLRAFTNQDKIADAHEPDNSQEIAQPLAADGTVHTHNVHEPDDTDWVRFTAEARSYIIKSTQIGPEGDTELALFDSSGRQLTQNDDYSDDASSQIGYRFSQPGEYFVRVRLYNPTKSGAGTEYELTIEPGELIPTPPPPTETPPDAPPATPTPPPGDVKTLILVNASRMSTLWPDEPTGEDVPTLLTKLDQLARHPKVQGEVIQLNRNAEVSAAYDAWTATTDSYLSVESANQVADAIRRLIMGYLIDRSGVEYVLLVGDDRALPFRRVIDATPQESSNTYKRINDNHPTGAAFYANYYLTDDFFVDREPIAQKGREIYVPDLTMGRLIEKPSDMINLINIFLDKPVTEVTDVLVSGWDFVQDSAIEDCDNWRKALGDDSRVDCLISDEWRKSELLDRQSSTEPRYVIQSINGHADHDRQGTPDNSAVSATELDAAPFTLPGGLVYTLACHAGLNIPEENGTRTTDLAESFARKGSNYIANAGYGWGYRGAIGLSEQMMQLITARLVEGGPMGPALSGAKQEYYRLTQARSAYDEKVMQELIYYGLPMFETPGSGSLSDDPFSGLVDDTFDDSPGSLSSSVLTKTVSFDFSQALAEEGAPLPLSGDQENEESFGSYPTLAGYAYAEPDQPVQALYFKDVTVNQNAIRSVVVRRADINSNVLEDFDPVVATPDNEFVTPDESQIAPLGSVADAVVESAWYPASIVEVQSLNGTSTLATKLGQFNPATNEQRTFENLEVDVYYSLSSDVEPPEFTLVDGLVTPDCGTSNLRREVTVKVGVQDSSGIEEVTLQYVVDNQNATSSLESLNMSYDANAQKWIGKYQGGCDSRFQVSAMDKAFNRALANNKGERYSPVPARVEGLRIGEEIYLPFVQN